jgi:hypothetical protein
MRAKREDVVVTIKGSCDRLWFVLGRAGTARRFLWDRAGAFFHVYRYLHPILGKCVRMPDVPRPHTPHTQHRTQQKATLLRVLVARTTVLRGWAPLYSTYHLLY